MTNNLIKIKNDAASGFGCSGQQSLLKVNSYSKGFTLVEALVATSVFAFVVSSIVGIYISTIQLDRKTRGERAVAENARFIMEFLAKEVRNGRIDYASYPGQTANEIDQLYVVNQSDEAEAFRLEGSNCATTGVCNITLTKNPLPPTNLNSANVKVTKLEFRAGPLENPYVLANNDHEQPKVTIILELQANTGNSISDQAKINLQTTLSTRYYPARN